jgi:tetratricopeptide (TPR) repeat protein
VAYRLDHKYDQAKPLLARGLELSKGMSSPDATVVGRLRFNLAIIDRDEGKDGEAEQFFSEALANFEKDPVAAEGDDAGALLNLGFLRCKQGRFLEAEDLLLRSIGRYEAVHCPCHTDNLASAHYQC